MSSKRYLKLREMLTTIRGIAVGGADISGPRYEPDLKFLKILDLTNDALEEIRSLEKGNFRLD